MKNDEKEHLTNNDNGTSAGIRTKILSKSGFSGFIVKNSLKDKGILCNGPVRKAYGVQFRSTSNLNAAGATAVFNAPLSLTHNSHVPLSNAPLSLTHNYAPLSNAPLSLTHNSHAPLSNAPLSLTHNYAPLSNAPLSLTHNSHAPLSNAPLNLTHNYAPLSNAPLSLTHNYAPLSNAPLSLTHNSHAPLSNVAVVEPRISPSTNTTQGRNTLRESETRISPSANTFHGGTNLREWEPRISPSTNTTQGRNTLRESETRISQSANTSHGGTNLREWEPRISPSTNTTQGRNTLRESESRISPSANTFHGGTHLREWEPRIGPSTNTSQGHNTLRESQTRISPSANTSHGVTSLKEWESRISTSANASHAGTTLREWLKAGKCRASKLERLYLFRQILDLVHHSHSQGFALQHLRPSFFSVSSSNQVVYIGSSVPQESTEGLVFREDTFTENNRPEKRPSGQFFHLFGNRSIKKQKSVENQMYIRNDPQISANGNYANQLSREYDGNSSNYYLSISSQQVSSYASDPLEESWYASPEERSGMRWSFSSNIYLLGFLLFELLSCFDSESARATAMSNLQHGILPPDFLLENPKEAGLCLWLLHSEPSSRPTAREALKSEVFNGIEESFGHELSTSMEEDDGEAELLSHFLTSLQQQKKKDSMKLEEEIKCIEADIQEIKGCRTGKPSDFSFSSEPHVDGEELSSSWVTSKAILKASDAARFVKNISQLESAYFSMRTDIQNLNNDVATRRKSDLLTERNNKYQKELQEEKGKPTDRVGDFYSGLCRYARYSKFEVRGLLRNRKFHGSANGICSMSFDRDQEYFAAAGISKRIKIFEFQSLFNEAVGVHYPAVEMPNKSRLSCVCWNSYIRNYLASTDYDGSVKLWDAGTGQVISEYSEHRQRAWSVDFSQVDPTKLASGSDDFSVKLWSMSEKNSIRTMKSAANALSVQFSGHSSHLLAFGCADHKTYCYDLRHTSVPWCILSDHDKAVSYVKFLDSETLVSASTDNTLKIWDLSKTSSSGSSASACILTCKGHTNEKNFVGLSASDGYIACGSETNEVYAYYKSLPMPITSHKFDTIDPVFGKDADDDNGQFISSVCWKQNSDMLLAANSSGCIKVLQMV